MSLPSFKLSKQGGTWWAEGKLPSGRPFRIDCGTGSREKAEAAAELKVGMRVQLSKAGKARWTKTAQPRSSAVIPESSAPAAAEDLEETFAAPQPEAPTSSAPPRRSNEEIRAKLLHLGDVGSAGDESVRPDEIIPPDSPRAHEDEPMDEDVGEALADVLATGCMTGLVWVANRPLRKRNPPMQGEPHEKGLEWFQAGAKYNLQKIVGRSTTMGPTGKMFLGAGIICASVWMSAEPIDARPHEPAPAPASSATPPAAAGEATPPAAHANGTTPAASSSQSTALTVSSALGSFGVEKRTAN